MNNTKNLIIIGAGGVGGFLAYNIHHLGDQYRLIGFLDDNKELCNQNKFDYNILGSVDDASNYTDCLFLLGIAFPRVKQKITERLNHLHLEFINYISPSAYISPGVKIGKGVIIYPNSFVDHHCTIGDYVTINACCSVGHDSLLDNFSTLGPNVGLAGYTQCLEGSEIGIGAMTKQNVVIGKDAMVGGQAMVVSDVRDHTLAVGVPAKQVKK